MITVQPKINLLVQWEYEAAKRDHAPLASAHEWYALMLEEVQETEEALQRVKDLLAESWASIRANDAMPDLPLAELISAAAHTAGEAIQVAAVGHRMVDRLLNEGGEPPMKGHNTFMDLVDREVRRRMDKERRILRQMCKDAADMAANAVFSLGESRVPAWDAEYARAFNWILGTTLEDGKSDKDLWYTKTKTDEVLQRIRGAHFVPWKQRY